MANKSKKRGNSESDQQRPPQSQSRQPGRQHEMDPQPITIREDYRASGRLEGRVVLITGGDSGIGRSVAVMAAREGAQVAVVYLEETQDAADTRDMIQESGQQCLLIQGDVGDADFCRQAVQQTIEKFQHLDVLINNAAEQHAANSIEDIDEPQLVRTFRTNMFSMFFMTQAALPYLRQRSRSSIINTTSVTAYRGSPGLLDYSSTKGAITAFTRSLSLSLIQEGIRVNAVAPGPVWTPLIPASFPESKVAKFGGDTPLGRAGQPHEIGSCYTFLASDDATYINGQVLHPNGGEIING